MFDSSMGGSLCKQFQHWLDDIVETKYMHGMVPNNFSLVEPTLTSQRLALPGKLASQISSS